MRQPNVTRDLHGGVQHEYKFPNGYGASVVRHKFSYGGDEGLWELAVLDRNGVLTYDTPITEDVIGYLTEEQVDAFLMLIEALTPEAITEGE